jgi:hypothetical protein
MFVNMVNRSLVVPWLNRVDAGLSPRRPGFDPGSLHVEFVVGQSGTRTGFSPSTWVFPCQFHSTGAPLQGKTKKLIIFIAGLHNKPQGCGEGPRSNCCGALHRSKKTGASGENL